MGYVYNHMVYALPFPLGYNNYNIDHLEMIDVMVALKICGQNWSNRYINISCVSLPVVKVLSTGRAPDNVLAACARTFGYLLLCTYRCR